MVNLKGVFLFMKNIIRELFYDYQQAEEYVKEFENMPGKQYIEAAQETFVTPTFKNDYDKGSALDSILKRALSTMEDFAFEQGFKFAMRLRDACDSTTSKQ